MIHEFGEAMGAEDTGPTHDVKRSSQEIHLAGGSQPKRVKNKANPRYEIPGAHAQ